MKGKSSASGRRPSALPIPSGEHLSSDPHDEPENQLIETFVAILLLLGFKRERIQERVMRSVLPENLKPLKRLDNGISDTGRLLSFWASDRRFLTDDGRPCDLLIRGPGRSFEELVARVLPGASADEYLTLLIDSGSVMRVKGRRIRLRNRIASRGHSRGVSVESALLPLQGLLDTMKENLMDVAKGKVPRLVDLGVSGFELDQTQFDELNRMFARNGMLLLETVDAWLTQTERENDSRVAPGRRLRPYVGIFVSKNIGG